MRFKRAMRPSEMVAPADGACPQSRDARCERQRSWTRQTLLGCGGIVATTGWSEWILPTLAAPPGEPR